MKKFGDGEDFDLTPGGELSVESVIKAPNPYGVPPPPYTPPSTEKKKKVKKNKRLFLTFLDDRREQFVMPKFVGSTGYLWHEICRLSGMTDITLINELIQSLIERTGVSKPNIFRTMLIKFFAFGLQKEPKYNLCRAKVGKGTLFCFIGKPTTRMFSGVKFGEAEKYYRLQLYISTVKTGTKSFHNKMAIVPKELKFPTKHDYKEYFIPETDLDVRSPWTFHEIDYKHNTVRWLASRIALGDNLIENCDETQLCMLLGYYKKQIRLIEKLF